MGNPITDALLSETAAQATVLPVVQVNRARAAALVDLGYEYMAVYEAWKPVIFAASVAGVIVGGSALVRRIRTPEAVALYGIATAISGLAAWFTRPQWMFPIPPPVAPAGEGAPDSMNGLLGWVDNRAAQNSVERPGWESATFVRLASDLGIGTLNPAVNAFLTRNTH